MANIKNDEELRNVLSALAERIVDVVAEKALSHLRQNIVRWTYEFDDRPNEIYWNNTQRPTYEFLDAWETSQTQKRAREVMKEIAYWWETMEYDPSTYKHGDRQSGDLRSHLADLLNVEGYAESIFGPTKLRRPFWDITIQELFDGGLLDKWFKEEIQKSGFVTI